ncbi:3'-5' exonuclease [Clostridium sp. CTA-5]
MNYIIYDLEFNQRDPNIPKDDASNVKELPFEIIQIGAIKLDETFNIVSKFNTLINPTVYTTIHPYVEKLTKINSEMLSSCESFPKIYKDFLKFVGDDEAIFCVWGKVDIKELLRNIKYYNLSTSLISKYYIDVQESASKYFKVEKGCKIGLKNAVELLGILNEDEFHDAYYDAYYTSEVFKRIYNEDIKPRIYTTNLSRKMSNKKKTIDSVALIREFEKIYNRKMTKEEQDIIKLAYLMGKTNQFVK